MTSPISKQKTIGEKFDSWRKKHKGSLDSLYDAFAAGHVEGHLMAQGERDEARAVAKRYHDALVGVIRKRVQSGEPSSLVSREFKDIARNAFEERPTWLKENER